MTDGQMARERGRNLLGVFGKNNYVFVIYFLSIYLSSVCVCKVYVCELMHVCVFVHVHMHDREGGSSPAYSFVRKNYEGLHDGTMKWVLS